MLRKCLGTIGLIAISTIIGAQNLVPNPGFEDLLSPMPCDYVSSSQQFNSLIEHWTAPTEGSPDLHSKINPINCWSHCTSANTYTGSTCFRGPQYPHGDDIMCGIQLYKTTINCSPWMEYIQVQLSQPLTPGVEYYASMYASLSDYSPLAVDKLGMYFTDYAIIQTQSCPNIISTPQVAADTILDDIYSWTKIEGTFIAQSSHEFLTIGNFEAASATTISTGGSCLGKGAYYYIDDVTVMENIQLGLEEGIQQTINLKSNLVDNQLIIESNNDAAIDITIYDVSGRTIALETLNGDMVLDVSSMNSGFYTIVSDESSHPPLRFFKQ